MQQFCAVNVFLRPRIIITKCYLFIITNLLVRVALLQKRQWQCTQSA